MPVKTKLYTGPLKIGNTQKRLEKAAMGILRLADKAEDAVGFKAKLAEESAAREAELSAIKEWAGVLNQDGDGQGKRFKKVGDVEAADTTFEENFKVFAAAANNSRVPAIG